MTGEVKERWQIPDGSRVVPRVRKSGAGVPEFIEEGMDHGIDRRQTLGGGILKKEGDEVDSISVGLLENLVERMRLDLRELVFHIVRVHGSNLLPSRCSEDLDDLHQLVNARLSREEGLSKHELGHYASSRPDICATRLANV